MSYAWGESGRSSVAWVLVRLWYRSPLTGDRFRCPKRGHIWAPSSSSSVCFLTNPNSSVCVVLIPTPIWNHWDDTCTDCPPSVKFSVVSYTKRFILKSLKPPWPMKFCFVPLPTLLYLVSPAHRLLFSLSRLYCYSILCSTQWHFIWCELWEPLVSYDSDGLLSEQQSVFGD